eukprot:gi/632982883/ref/XP_007908374.1/ PREDICTED: unconventional myosin-Va-like [Callorhinchus milii]
MSAAELYTKATKLWIPDPEQVWISAELTKDYSEEDDDLLYLKLDDGMNIEFPIDKKTGALPYLRNPEILMGENDLTALSYLHEPAVLHNLKVRFLESNNIYTYCGIVLVAINPYEQLPLYGDDVIYAYSGHNVGDMDPHIFAVAEEAYKQLAREGKNQSIIISGESGAGKTMSAKCTMRYFATVGGSAGDTNVEERVLASNPIMEAFGNAKTTRNDNSSRFGKYIEIGFSVGHRIVGANVRTYLLEKSRVVFQAEQERNYHILYQLCASANLPEFLELSLAGGAESFSYTNQGGDIYINGTDDVADLERTRNAFSLLGICESDQMEIFRVLASVLHLGNITFQSKDRDGESSCIDLRDGSLNVFCELLGLERNQFAHWLCHRKLVTLSETYVKPTSRKQASNSRDALAKHLYGQLFHWIVGHINKALRSSSKQHNFIGVLDIYGFEAFENNSFEQFCINYANEKLQHQFTLHVFKLEQEEYMMEELSWTLIEFHDNQPCIELLEAKLGILDLLDEECRMPKGTDTSWAQKLYERHLHTSYYFQKPRMSNTAFLILHFADDVLYQCEGFLEKNRDTVYEEPINILRASKKSELVAELFHDKESAHIGRRPNPNVGFRSLRKSLPAKSEHKKTVGYQFRASLHLLMETLNSTTPHYVRCLKPNDTKQAFSFNPQRTVQQLRACGVLATIRLSAAGYPSRWTYPEFLSRYRVLLREDGLCVGDQRQTCKCLLENLIKDKTQYQFGRTKVFFRAGQVAYLEKLRGNKLRAACVLIQRRVRGWLQRRRYQHVRAATIAVQKYTRGFLAKRRTEGLRRARAALVIQKRYRMLVVRRLFVLLRTATVTIQAYAKGTAARVQYRKLVRERKAVMVQSWVRGWLARLSYHRTRHAVIFLQSCYRRMKARRELHKLKCEARSVEHYKQLNRGMENKILQLQVKVIEQNKENKVLVGQLASLAASYSRDFEKQKCELEQLQARAGDAKVLSLQRELEKLRAELDMARQEAAIVEEKTSREQTRLTESFEVLEKEKVQLSDELQKLKRHLQEQADSIEGNTDSVLHLSKYSGLVSTNVAAKSRELQSGFEAERSRYQNLVREFSRLEQRYENLKDEMSFIKESPGLKSNQSVQSCLSELSDQSSVFSALDAEGLIHHLEFQALENENRKLKAELEKGPGPGPRPGGRESSQDPLRSQLGAATREVNMYKEQLSQATRQLSAAERQIEEMKNKRLVLPRGGCKMTEEDLRHAYDAVCVANAILMEEIREQRAQHEDGTGELHTQLRALRQELDHQQEALGRERQQPAGTHPANHLQEEVYRLNNQNLELMEQAEKQDKMVYKLSRQLKAYVKSVKNFAVTSPASQSAGEPGSMSEITASVSTAGGQLGAGNFRGMLECKKEDEARFMRNLIIDLKPELPSLRELPSLPAFILFMVVRHADYTSDQPRAQALFTAILSSVKKVLKRDHSFETVGFWLTNVYRLLVCVRQYSGDESSVEMNTPEQRPHSLRNFDLSQQCLALSDLAIEAYHQLIRSAEERLQPMIVAGMLENDVLHGLGSVTARPGGYRRAGLGRESGVHTLHSLLVQLDSFHGVLTGYGLDPEIIKQVFRQIYYLIGAATLNNLLLRRDVCSFGNGVQIRNNVSRLQEWLSGKRLQGSGALEALQPLTQASQLLQLNKRTDTDAEAICSMCTALSKSQIVKILTLYTPINEYEERVTVDFIKNVQKRLVTRSPSQQLLVELKHVFAVNFPIVPSPVNLEKLRIPESLGLSFLKPC